MSAPIYKGGKWFFKSPLRSRSDIRTSASAAVQLVPSNSGATFLLDRASGVTYTLPAATISGLNFTFVVTVSVTSNNHKIVAKTTGTELYIGGVFETVAAGTGTEFFPNGSSNSAITMNGTTTGGLINTILYFQSINSTTWTIDGTVMASGTIATPFANS